MNPEACRQHLSQRQIHVAVRGSAVRVSPHVYNDENDLVQLADALSELAPVHRKRQR
jgi:selenocysteine lyase/cysteine desulfurase